MTNHKFEAWQEELNRQLAMRFFRDASYGDARDYFKWGYSPEEAAEELVFGEDSLTPIRRTTMARISEGK